MTSTWFDEDRRYPKTYTEGTATGTTTNNYVTALDLDERGALATTLTVKNTDGGNALLVKVSVRHSDYSAGTWDVVYPETQVDAGDEALIELIYGRARTKVEVKSASSGNHATYTVEYHQKLVAA